MRKKSTTPFLIAACVMTLSACGQKGPLYVPQDPDAQAAEAAQVQSSEQDTQAKKDKPAE